MPQREGEIVNNGDRVDYTFRLVAGKTYSIEMEGAPTGDMRYDLSDAYLRLYRGATQVDFNDDGGIDLNSRIIFTPLVTTNYRIEAAGYNDTHTGTFRLTVSTDDYRDLDVFDTAGATGAFSAFAFTGAEAQGKIEYQGDNDLFAINLIDGLSYLFQVEGRSSHMGALADPRLEIYDQSNVLLESFLNSGGGPEDVDATYTPGATGTYYLRVGEELDSARGTYSVFADLGRATPGADTVTGSDGNDGIAGLGGNDQIFAGAGDDRVHAGSGNDRVEGGAGDDTLVGGPGSDKLFGGDDDDTLVGVTGADLLVGGLGDDTFVLRSAKESPGGGRDTIRGGDGAKAYEGAGIAGGDVIDLSGIDARPGQKGDQAFSLGGGHGAGQIWLTDQGSVTILHGNTGEARFVVAIEDGGGVTAADYYDGDFVL